MYYSKKYVICVQQWGNKAFTWVKTEQQTSANTVNPMKHLQKKKTKKRNEKYNWDTLGKKICLILHLFHKI